MTLKQRIILLISTLSCTILTMSIFIWWETNVAILNFEDLIPFLLVVAFGLSIGFFGSYSVLILIFGEKDIGKLSISASAFFAILLLIFTGSFQNYIVDLQDDNHFYDNVKGAVFIYNFEDNVDKAFNFSENISIVVVNKMFKYREDEYIRIKLDFNDTIYENVTLTETKRSGAGILDVDIEQINGTNITIRSKIYQDLWGNKGWTYVNFRVTWDSNQTIAYPKVLIHVQKPPEYELKDVFIGNIVEEIIKWDCNSIFQQMLS